MYLKEVDINGFKSFANKIKFKFDKGMTAIVGPNGSGKSNIVDAIRWVLGEQKVKQLRGEKMEDVIFAGTELRKSQGYAYVSITFDNSDNSLEIPYEEVKVSRKLYRSGESEYMINDKICRLKDIHEIFYDTGIGKEGYSIIGQGQIDRILSGKPETRRELIDEAIGIVKFKKRKLEAQRKLDSDSINLIRLKDLLGEMENQLNPLKSQAEKAHKYIELSAELKNLEIVEFSNSYTRLRNILNDYENKIEIVNSDLEKAKNDYEISKNTNEKFELELLNQKSVINKINDEIKDLLSDMNELSTDENLLNQEIKFKKKNLEETDTRLKETKISLQAKLEEKKDNDLKLNEINIKITENKLKLTDIDIHHDKLKNELDKLNLSLENSRDELSKISDKEIEYASKISYSKAKIEYQLNEKENLKNSLENFKLDKENIDNNIKELIERRSDLEIKIKDNKNEQRECLSDLSLSKNKINNLTNDLDELKNIKEKYISKKEVIENIIQRYEGYGFAVKRVLEYYSNDSGNHGVVADIISVNEEYEVAIESALGSALQNIVTNNTETAKKMINTLYKNKWGKVTFLPLDNIKVLRVLEKNKIPKLEGVVDLASELVKYNRIYDKIIKYLLGNTLIVNNMDVAIKLNKDKFPFRIVTLKGEIVMPSGSMSGGSYKNSSNLLSRNREIDELNKFIEDTSLKIDINNKEYNKVQNKINKLNDKINELSSEYEKLNIENIKINEKIETQNNNIKTIINNINDAKEKLVNIVNKDENILENEYEKIISDKGKIISSISAYESNIAEKMIYFQDVLSEVNKIRTTLAKDTERLEIYNQNNDKLNKEINSIQKEITSYIEKIKDNENTISFNTTKIQDNLSKYDELKSKHSKYILKLKEAEDENQKIIDNNKKLYDDRESLNNIILDLEKEKIKLINVYESTENTFNSKVSYMWDEYALTYGEIIDNIPKVEYNDLELDIKKIKNKIRSFGSINVAAVEEYKVLNERYKFHDKQLKDIVESKNNLQKIINSLDKGMIEQFNSNYKKLEKNIEKVFKELFGGGKVSMELTDPDNILESGININAQPPGKKLQNMLQLSGGEKALTAISLMFAIQNLNPSPFCFLDEIEAALDDTNVVRFAEYLSNLKDNTQFIVITHRKGTMESADRLYGVTMQEKGISTLVSVELEKYV